MTYSRITLPVVCRCGEITYDPHSIDGALVCPDCVKQMNDADPMPEPCVCGRTGNCPSCTSEPIMCPRCQIELGTGRFQCQRARNSDLCMDCALGIDPPTDGPYELTENEL